MNQEVTQNLRIKTKRLGLYGLCLLQFTACFPFHSEVSVGTHPDPHSSHSPRNTIGGRNRQNPRGELLFRSDLTPSEISDLKTEFLRQTPLESTRASNRFNINATRGPYSQAKSPIIHTYHEVGALVPLAVSLPASFRFNVPHEIVALISRYDILDLDLLFTPQDDVIAADASLKPAWWMFPNRPYLDLIHGAPREYQKTVLLGVFDSDVPLEGQVRMGEMTSFHVSLHDGRVSPDTGHVRPSTHPNASYAFYSLAIFEEQARAVVTLHWMLTREDREALFEILNAVAESPQRTFQNLLDEMNRETSRFHGRPMMIKLLDLVRP